MLGEIDQLRQRARRTLGAPWFPLVCFGALTMLSAPLLAVAGTAVLAPFWIPAGGGGMLFTRRHYRRRIRGRGVAGHGRRAWAVGVPTCAGAFAAADHGGTAAGEVPPACLRRCRRPLPVSRSAAPSAALPLRSRSRAEPRSRAPWPSSAQGVGHRVDVRGCARGSRRGPAREDGRVSHPSRRLDDSVHQRTRLGILAVLCEAGQGDFVYLRDTLELTDGNLSRNLTRLEEAGYVRVEKVLEGRRPRTWVSLTRAGRAALDVEIAALREIIAGVAAPHGRRVATRPLADSP